MKKTHRYRLVLILWLIILGAAAYFFSLSYIRNQVKPNDYPQKEIHIKEEKQITKKVEPAQVPQEKVQKEPFAQREHIQETIPTESTSEVPPMFYLKMVDDYVIVYYGDGITLYETTDIYFQGLPSNIKQDILLGKPIYTLDELYNFLENYSS
ncbi:MAG: hypothetical protein RR364_04690 [Lachnospiraceae bacterium]